MSPRLGCSRSAEAEVHLSVCAQHRGSASPLKIRTGDVAGRRTAPPPHFLLPKIPPAPSPLPPPDHHPALSLQEHPPRRPFRPRRTQIRDGFSRAAARRLALVARRIALRLDATDLACLTVPWQREPPPLLSLHSSCHAWPIRCLRSGLPSLIPLASTPSLRFVLFRGLAPLP
ncbi:hypothetical protein HU200_027519 [Digitaria exilis]|uniref:Uncharacterized protein n=1 Tax=Digitaria exilis TaxID=1010633 RepID=A0A835EWG1_9POAL|nr:hypothetical protein HU200_027519 [Digitaria exilis]